MAETTPPATRPAVPRRLVFRVPASALVGVVFLAVCESVVVTSRVVALLYVIPIAIAVWVLRTRTVVDAEKVVVRRVFTRRVLPWSSVASLRVRENHWARAVLTDGRQVTLPSVRTRHLPALALVTGRVTDPTTVEEPAPEQSQAEEPAADAPTPADQG